MENTIEYDKKIKTVGGYYHVIKDDKFGLADKKGNIIFPFYRDEQLVFVKHRIPPLTDKMTVSRYRDTVNSDLRLKRPTIGNS